MEPDIERKLAWLDIFDVNLPAAERIGKFEEVTERLNQDMKDLHFSDSDREYLDTFNRTYVYGDMNEEEDNITYIKALVNIMKSHCAIEDDLRDKVLESMRKYDISLAKAIDYFFDINHYFEYQERFMKDLEAIIQIPESKSEINFAVRCFNTSAFELQLPIAADDLTVNDKYIIRFKDTLPEKIRERLAYVTGADNETLLKITTAFEAVCDVNMELIRQQAGKTQRKVIDPTLTDQIKQGITDMEYLLKNLQRRQEC